MHWHVGTIGFSYSDWQNTFYPPGTRPADYLPTLATAFDTLELDTTFHALPTQDRIQKWTNAVPPHFTFCVKTPRAITHEAPIAFGTPAMNTFLHALRPMQKAQKLGPILIQFPPSFPAAEFPNLQIFLRNLPKDFNYAVEFRNPTWENQRTFDLLHKYNCCWTAADYSIDPFPIHITSNFLYLRLIGSREQFPDYTHERIDLTPRLQWWIDQIHAAATPSLQHIYIFINDDYAGHGPATVNRFRTLLNLPAKLPASQSSQQSLF